MFNNLGEKGKKCAVKANNFPNPGTMFMLVLGALVLYGFAFSISQRFPQDIGHFIFNHR
jgi:hypothetical protein